MRRVTMFLAVVVLFVGGVAVGVNAQSDAPRQPSRAARELVPVNPDKLREIHQILTETRNLKRGGGCPTGPLSISIINCNLQATQRQLVKLDKFVNSYLNCTQYVQLTQYGDSAGGFGYVFDPGTGVTFKTTGVDYTEDLKADPFDNFTVLGRSDKCLKFAN